jgi:thiol-disulfide isomerase/thioredoxin
MHYRSAMALAAVASLMALQAAPARASAPADVCQARSRSVLEASARAYRAMPALRDTLRYLVEAPGSERAPKELAFGFGPGEAVFVEDAAQAAFAVGGRLHVTRANAPGVYVVVPYEGDLAASIDAVLGAHASLFEPGPIAMRSGKPYPAWIDALRFRQLGPLAVVGCGRVAGPGGGALDEIRLAADNGTVSLRVDRRTHLFSSISLELRPPGAPEGFAVKVEGTFSPRVLSRTEGAVRFDPAGRRAVASLADLRPGRLAPGTAAPDATFADLAGQPLALRDLRGSVVVLDFWATWCAPCWTTLREAQELADWAAGESLPVVVLAVNAVEDAPDPSARRERVAAFWRSQGLSLRPVLDPGDAAFKALGSLGLPSAVVVGRDGVVAAAHAGIIPEAQATLRAEVRRALDEGAAANPPR